MPKLKPIAGRPIDMTKYRFGRPCKNCGTRLKYRYQGHCVQCKSERNKKETRLYQTRAKHERGIPLTSNEHLLMVTNIDHPILNRDKEQESC